MFALCVRTCTFSILRSCFSSRATWPSVRSDFHHPVTRSGFGVKRTYVEGHKKLCGTPSCVDILSSLVVLLNRPHSKVMSPTTNDLECTTSSIFKLGTKRVTNVRLSQNPPNPAVLVSRSVKHVATMGDVTLSILQTCPWLLARMTTRSRECNIWNGDSK